MFVIVGAFRPPRLNPIQNATVLSRLENLKKSTNQKSAVRVGQHTVRIDFESVTSYFSILKDRLVIDFEVKRIELDGERRRRGRDKRWSSAKHGLNEPVAYPGKDIILRFYPEFNGPVKTELFTDSNSIDFVKRDRKGRVKDLIPSMYYPITSQAFLKKSDNSNQFTITIDRSAGVASLKNTELEIMLHRRGLSDDCKGLKEALNDVSPTKGKIFLNFGVLERTEMKRLEKEINHKVLEMSSQSNIFAKSKLPNELHLLDAHIDDFDESLMVIRLENLSKKSIEFPNILEVFNCKHHAVMFNLPGTEVVRQAYEIRKHQILTFKCEIL